MILNALVDYYQILQDDENSQIPKQGYSEENVHLCLVIDKEGNLKNVNDLREKIYNKKKSKLVPIKLTLPERVQRSRGIVSNYLWENAEYALAVEKKKDKGDQKKKEETFKRFQCFYDFHYQLLNSIDDEGAKALLSFLDKHKNNDYKNALIEKVEDDINNGEILVFRLEGDYQYLHERPELIKVWEQHYFKNDDKILGFSLISGNKGPIAKNHSVIKGVKNAQSSGARIVSFNENAFESYGHKNGYIAPITEEEMFQYTTALNYILSRRKQHIQIGDCTIVFWSKTNFAEQTEIIYSLLTGEQYDTTVVGDKQESEKQHETNIIRTILQNIKQGKKINLTDYKLKPKTEFYILGISPNNARLSIRFFHKTSFGKLVSNISNHYKDIEIFTVNSYAGPLTPRKMLNEASIKDSKTLSVKEENIHPLLGGNLFKSLLDGKPYPNMLYQQILLRIRAGEDVNYYKAASIKGYLLRKARNENNLQKERMITVALNDERDDFAYVFGRLFAVLENTQLAANPGIDRTIKNAYFSRASTTPKVVFSTLLRLNQHHQDKISKVNKGHQIFIDKLVTNLVSRIDNVPAQLNYEEQGEFVLGYYQQKQELFKKKGDEKIEESN